MQHSEAADPQHQRVGRYAWRDRGHQGQNAAVVHFVARESGGALMQATTPSLPLSRRKRLPFGTTTCFQVSRMADFFGRRIPD